MFNKNDPRAYDKILFPLFFALGGSMLLYTLSGMIKAIPLIAIFFTVSVGFYFYALWNIWQMVDEKFHLKIYAYIFLFSLFFHGTTFMVDIYFQGIIATIYGYVLMRFFWNLLTDDSKENIIKG